MIRISGAALRPLLFGLLVAGLAGPALAWQSRQERLAARAMAERVEVAVAEVAAKRKRGERVWCVPFARSLSGLEIKGNARTWWAGAEGRYARGAVPKPGSVMVFSGSRSMPMGHVAVVAEIVSDRRILIDHANWVRNKVSLRMAVEDVSAARDWSAVRVESEPGVPGRINPVYGFIYPGELMASN
jgi:hypothetical protein